MHLDMYLARSAALWTQGQQPADPFFPNDPESIRPYLRFVWQAVCAHAWLQSAALHGVLDGDPRVEGLRCMREHAEASARRLAYLISEADPFEADPHEGSLHYPIGAEAPDGWLHVGLSALILQLLAGPAGAWRVHPETSAHRDLAWIAEGFGLEHAYALSEAGRSASRLPDGAERLRKAIGTFQPAGELAWNGKFFEDAYAFFSAPGVEWRTSFKSAMSAIRGVPELPRDPWPYLEPHLLRHGDRLGIGRVKRWGIKKAVGLLAGK